MNERYDHYDSWAWLYDETIGPCYGIEQFTVLERVLLPHLSPGAHLFDLCCGTGQLIRSLLKAGYKVTGLDGSEEMLARARVNAPEADYILEDARKYREIGKYDAAFSTSASLNHIPTLADLRAVFANIFASLKNDGIFVFDLNHHEQMKKWWRDRPLEGTLNKDWAWMVTPSYQSEENKGHFRVTTARRSKNNPFFSAFLRPFKIALYKLLSRERFIGLRLKLIQGLAKIEPHWDHRQMEFSVTGHSLEDILKILKEVGFQQVDLQALDGKSDLDADHSAYFICRKGNCGA